MVRDYELMYIARPDLDEEGLQGAVSSVEQLITGAGGSVVTTTSWGRRRLAYEVDHLRDGHYMLLHLRLDGARVAGVERALAIHETVFRHLLVVREEPKAADGADAAEDAVTSDPGETEPAAAGRSRQAPVATDGEDAGGDGEGAVAVIAPAEASSHDEDQDSEVDDEEEN